MATNYEPVHVVRADVEAGMVHADFIAALNEDKAIPPVEKEGLWDTLAEAVDAEVSAAVAFLSSMGRTALPESFWRYYARIAMCHLLYIRRGLSGERNPFEDGKKAILDKIDAIASGAVRSVGFAHIAIEDAQPNIFIEDGE